MTAIAAVTDGRTVWMGADTGATAMHVLVFQQKIARLRVPGALGDHDVLLGTSGSAAIRQAFVRHVKIDGAPDPESDRDCDEWTQALSEAWTGAVSDLPMGPKSTDEDGCAQIDGVALLAYAGRIWRLATNHAVRYGHGWAAIGAGAEACYGAFHATQGMQIPQRDRLELALDAACTWIPGCYRPMQFEVLAWPD